MKSIQLYNTKMAQAIYVKKKIFEEKKKRFNPYNIDIK